VRLREIQGDLALEIYNYLGENKPFWEQGWPGAFYQGKPQCGFYLEMAERSEYPDGRAFGRAVAAGALQDLAEAPFVYTGEHPRRWQVSYERGGALLGLEIDLMEWKLLRRWTQDGELGMPMLQSPAACQSTDGEIRLGGAVLRWGSKSPAWLFASPVTGRWAAGYTGVEPAPLTLEVPGGRVAVEAMGAGTVVWDQGKVSVEAVALRGEPQVTTA
jgi:hypothetical protein